MGLKAFINKEAYSILPAQGCKGTYVSVSTLDNVSLSRFVEFIASGNLSME